MHDTQAKDWFIEKLGASQQKVMSLTVAKRRVERRLELIENRADQLESLLMDIYMSGILDEETTQRITKLMCKIDDEDARA
jgi:hypothetical protein